VCEQHLLARSDCPAGATRGESLQEENYDAIVVDEAQDFGAAGWPPTLACCATQETGGCNAFLDEAQRFSTVTARFYPAARSCWTKTSQHQQIAQLFGSLVPGRPMYRGMDGPPVRSSSARHESFTSLIRNSTALARVWKAPGQLVAAGSGWRHQLQRRICSRYHGWDGYWDAFFARR